MGRFVNTLWLRIAAWSVAAIIVVLNLKFLWDSLAPAAWRG